MILSLILPTLFAKPIINLVLNVLMSDPSTYDAKVWARDKFTPAMLRVSKDFRLSLSKKMALVRRFVGVLIKLAWAFLW